MADALFSIPVTVPDLTAYDVIVVNSSAGKDSQAMLDYVAELADAAGVADRVTVVHNDLGTTDGGLPVEWPGTADLAAEQAEHYGFNFVITWREKGGLFQQLRVERRKFPSSSARWCTSDQKTAQGLKAVSGLCRQWRQERGLAPAEGRPVEVLYCLGIRAAESAARGRKPALEVNVSGSSARRSITRWLPIHAWSEDEVWQRVRASGVPYHPAYDQGMSRLSCSLCVLASREDLVRACQLRPDLAREYAALEVEIGHRFQAGASMAELMEQAGVSQS